MALVVAIIIAAVAVIAAAAPAGLGRLRGPGYARASCAPDGYQEVNITVQGRYRPNSIQVEQGMPVRLRFLRAENDACSERVVFSGLGIDRRLPAFKETTVEFLPRDPGTYLFTCERGIYRGRLVVAHARRNGARSAGEGTRRAAP